jgi:hypothetical protein
MIDLCEFDMPSQDVVSHCSLGFRSKFSVTSGQRNVTVGLYTRLLGNR